MPVFFVFFLLFFYKGWASNHIDIPIEKFDSLRNSPPAMHCDWQLAVEQANEFHRLFKQTIKKYYIKLMNGCNMPMPENIDPQNQSWIFKIPTPIRMRIYSYLPDQALAHIRQTCQREYLNHHLTQLTFLRQLNCHSSYILNSKSISYTKFEKVLALLFQNFPHQPELWKGIMHIPLKNLFGARLYQQPMQEFTAKLCALLKRYNPHLFPIEADCLDNNGSLHFYLEEEERN